ncbi:hypothetical protein TRQ7_08685 [Thermotoga sp. RQ7]|uniref:hypothetical protein n=1 Tax=Thermotoga sp. RQ7 TaxID=126738 RepID=UPI00040CE5C9|nr:hypothetical protein [Thermotoga sp. RQ7]AJG41518.1 hypothetical protein TRQ7_08685 [Thermotoga sp. RQ7]MDK2786455.1 hypothetical protein [Thermotoga sp.]
MKKGSLMIETLISLILILLVIAIFMTMILVVIKNTANTERSTKAFLLVNFAYDYLSKFRVGHKILESEYNVVENMNKGFWNDRWSDGNPPFPYIENLQEENIALPTSNGTITYKKITLTIRTDEQDTITRVVIIGD